MNFGVEGCATMASSASCASLIPFGELLGVEGMIVCCGVPWKRIFWPLS